MGLTKAKLHVAASLLILIGLALLVIGLQDGPLLWQIGLGIVAVAMIISLGTRWAPQGEDDESSGHPGEEHETEHAQQDR